MSGQGRQHQGVVALWTSAFASSPDAAPVATYRYNVRRDGVVPGSGEIFADGFESGDTSAWSSNVP